MHSSKPTKQDVEFFMLNHGSLTHYKGSSIFLLPGRGFGSCCQGGLPPSQIKKASYVMSKKRALYNNLS